MSEAFKQIIFSAEDVKKLIDSSLDPYVNKCRLCNQEVPKNLVYIIDHLRHHDKPEIYEWITCPECNGEKFCDYADGEDSRRGACDVCNPHGDEGDEDRAYDEYKDAQAEAHFEELEHKNAEGSQ